MKKELATLGVALAGLVAAARAGDAAQESICIPLAQLKKVRADVFANVADAMKDPNGKGPALILRAKRNFDSLEFTGKANVTKTKNNNEKNKADARRLSSCVDYPGWKDAYENSCADYSQFSIWSSSMDVCTIKRFRRQQRTLGGGCVLRAGEQEERQ